MAFPLTWRPGAMVAVLSTSASAAFASQGPGGGPGTASATTQLAMAIAVYGGAAIILAAGIIGLLRRRLTKLRNF